MESFDLFLQAGVFIVNLDYSMLSFAHHSAYEFKMLGYSSLSFPISYIM